MLIGLIKATIPKIQVALKAAAPKRLPKANSPRPLTAALMPNDNSGKVVPNATIKAPTKNSDIPILKESALALETIKKAENNKKPLATAKIVKFLKKSLRAENDGSRR